jgi:phosphatidate cytidylyltransferase
MTSESDTGPLPRVGRPELPPLRSRTEPATTELAVPATGAIPAPSGAAIPAPGGGSSVPPSGASSESPPDAGTVPASDAGSAPPSGRAGRNLVAAIGVGLTLGGVILASLLVHRPAFLAVLLAAVLVSVVELSRALQSGGAAPPMVPVVVGAVAMIGLAWTRGPAGLVVAFLLTVLAVLLWRLGDGPEGYLRDASAGVLVALYVPLLAGFAALLLVPDDGAVRVLAFIATVVGNDVGGYAAGVLFGRHPMAPSVSPKKSWEGMAGSIVACVVIATPIVTLGLDGPWWGGVLFGAALAVTATVGDLGESLIKRDLGIKDMGNLLPGHGGLMDRMDSLLPSAAVAYLLLSWVAPA